MKDKYTGDIGDFAKIILLNELASLKDITLGINWYYNNRVYSYEKNQEDGKYIQYLMNDKKGLKKYEPDLYQNLLEIVQRDERKIKNLFGLIHTDTNYHFDDEVPNKSNRAQWIEDSLHKLSPTNLIFLDPDNGISYNDTNGNAKHVLQSEIEQIFEAGKSVVIYNHSDRQRREYYFGKFTTIAKRLCLKSTKIFILRASLFSARDYVFFLHEGIQTAVEEKLIYIEKQYPNLFKLLVIPSSN